MENEIISRIKLVRKELNLSQAAFAEKLGFTRGKIENVELGRVDPNNLFLQQICKVYNVDRDWLETGEGDMFMPMEEEDELLAYAAELITNKDLDWIKQLNLTLMNMTPEELDVVEKFARNWLDRMNKKEKEQD